MTEPERSQPVPEDDSTTATATDVAPAAEGDAEPPPEPWTPERSLEMNAYYDVYVKWAALILVFMVSCNYVNDSHLWVHLKTGQFITDHAAPIAKDVFSYTEEGRPWVNVPWLFQVVQAAVYKLVYGLVPVNPVDTTANRASAENIGVASLVALAALLRLLTAWLLFKIRHPGPAAWWSAICIALALGVSIHPVFGFNMGGIAGPGIVAPVTWGLVLLAFEMWLLFRAFSTGRGAALWLLVPVFVLWANVDESFLIGLALLAASAVGAWLDGSRTAGVAAAAPTSNDGDASGARSSEALRMPARASTALIVLACSAVACLVNPYTYRVYLAALSPFSHWFQPAGTITTVDQLSFFSRALGQQIGPDWYMLPAYYSVVVALGLASFVLNLRRFAWSRFLMFATMAVLWGLLMHLNAAFAVVLAAVVAPNGQEWYHDRFGTEGRIERRWNLWSTGGRLVTLTLIFLLMSKDITGWGNTQPEVQFGLGFNQDDFPFEAAEFLNNHNEIQGNVLNTSLRQGDVLIWKAARKRKVYVDGRPRLYPPELLEQWRKTRNAVRDDEVAQWKPLLDKYSISVVMIETGAAPMTYRRLMKSANWVPFYDDGRIVMFGRADAPKSELAFFNANRLDPELRAFRTTQPVVGAERPPNPTSWIDDIFQARTFSRPHTRTESARRWLEGLGSDDAPSSGETQPIPEPSRCFLAIREARIALARSPDDWIAFRRLKDAYRFLMVQEAAMLAGIPIIPENRDKIRAVPPTNIEHLMNRYQQRVTALNYAIQTTPAPRSAPARADLMGLNMELFQLYFSGNALDLARDRLKALLELSTPDDFTPEMRAQLEKQRDQLIQQTKQAEDKLEDFTIERQAGPIEQANFALSQGGTGTAIAQLADAERSGISPAVVKPRLVDLYCNTGQPEKALELLAVGAIDDPNLGPEPGAGALRQGRVYFLLGNYLSAATLWQTRAIPRAREDRTRRILEAARAAIHGEAVQTTSELLSVPASLTQQATWEYDLAMCQLEAGTPEDAATHFKQALTLAPELPVRRIAAYYLTKMGKPVPEIPKRGAGVAKAATPPGSSAPKPETRPLDAKSQPAPTKPSAPASTAPPPGGPRPAEPAKAKPADARQSRQPAPKASP
jgi:tetratricopeptide (TPR) repeat protein